MGDVVEVVEDVVLGAVAALPVVRVAVATEREVADLIVLMAVEEIEEISGMVIIAV